METLQKEVGINTRSSCHSVPMRLLKRWAITALEGKASQLQKSDVLCFNFSGL